MVVGVSLVFFTDKSIGLIYHLWYCVYVCRLSVNGDGTSVFHEIERRKLINLGISRIHLNIYPYKHTYTHTYIYIYI